MAKIETRELLHLWIQYNPHKGDPREVIIDEENKDIRICDGQTVAKIQFDENNKLKGILVMDVFVWTPTAMPPPISIKDFEELKRVYREYQKDEYDHEDELFRLLDKLLTP